MMKSKAFTLAELLLALVILGVIATFTIPKVLSSQQDTKYKSAAKEAAAMISDAYKAYQLAQGSSAATTGANLTPYLNYVSYDTSGTLVNQAGASIACDNSFPCLRTHNGGTLRYGSIMSFGATAGTSALFFQFDPDGQFSSVQNVTFFLYYSGRLLTHGDALSNTQSSTNTWNACGCDPTWFGWN